MSIFSEDLNQSKEMWIRELQTQEIQKGSSTMQRYYRPLASNKMIPLSGFDFVSSAV